MPHTTIDYRLAMGHMGPLAPIYLDKPQQLVYDLANAIDNLQEVLRAGLAELERMDGKFEGLAKDAASDKTLQAMRKALVELDVTRSAKWGHYLYTEAKK